MIRQGQRPQRTLARSTEISGVGFITGARVTVRFRPAPEDAGLVFLRTDLPQPVAIPARAEYVSGSRRRTTLGNGANQVTLVEHVLAALSGMRIDNCIIEIDGPEAPGVDGSSGEFVDAIAAGGLVPQQALRGRWMVQESITLRQGDATLSIHPGPHDELKISYILDYGPHAPIPPQTHTEWITPSTFRSELAWCRTFLLESEAREFQKQGVGKHLTGTELLVFGRDGAVNNPLRFADEPARHKLLDLVGDLSLCGVELVGHVVAYRSGHPLNVEMAGCLSRISRESTSNPPARRSAA